MVNLTDRRVPIWNKRVLDLRGSSDLTDREWCKRVGIVQANMKGYQDGSRSFTVKQLITAAKMYNTTLDYLCGLTDKKMKPERKPSPIELIEEGLRMLKSNVNM